MALRNSVELWGQNPESVLYTAPPTNVMGTDGRICHLVSHDSQHDSQIAAQLRTMPDVHGMCVLGIELQCTLMDGRGRPTRGLQNRLRVVRRRPFKIAYARRRPMRARMTAIDSQRYGQTKGRRPRGSPLRPGCSYDRRRFSKTVCGAVPELNQDPRAPPPPSCESARPNA